MLFNNNHNNIINIIDRKLSKSIMLSGLNNTKNIRNKAFIQSIINYYLSAGLSTNQY